MSRPMLEITGARDVLRPSPAGFWTTFTSALGRVVRQVHVRKKERVLRIEETLPLGDRRFLAIVNWKDERMLIGVTPQNITRIDQQEPKEDPSFDREGNRQA